MRALVKDQLKLILNFLILERDFGSRVPGEGQHVRFSYAASNEMIEKGIARMADFVKKNTK